MGCCCLQNIHSVDDNDQNMSDSRVLMSQNKQALNLKQQGNQQFKKKAYLNAIKCYQQALAKNPKELVYYTNLALAYRANGQYLLAVKTIDSIQRKPFNPSPNYMQLMTKGNVIKARCINSLTKKYIVDNAYTVQESQAWLQKVEEAVKLLKEAKKNSSIQVDQFLNNSQKLKTYLTKIKENTAESQVVDYLKDKIRQSRNGLHSQKGWQKIKDFYPDQIALLQQVQSLYSKFHLKFIEEADQEQDYLVDPITYEKYIDPVIVPSGISYEQATLKEYFKKGQQYKDPITRENFPVGQRVIVKNHTLKNYISEMGKLNEIRKQDIQLLVC